MTTQRSIYSAPEIENSFEEWMRQVDEAIAKITDGEVTSSDLADYCYRDSFDYGFTPYSTAKRAIRFAKGMND